MKQSNTMQQLHKVLDLIHDGRFYATYETVDPHSVYISVSNPDCIPDDGSDLNLVVQIKLHEAD